MPIIRPSSELRNKYNEISELCHKQRQTIYITKNGAGDLAVMSIEDYEFIKDRLELYESIQEGLDAVKEGKTIQPSEAKKRLKKIIEF